MGVIVLGGLFVSILEICVGLIFADVAYRKREKVVISIIFGIIAVGLLIDGVHNFWFFSDFIRHPQH